MADKFNFTTIHTNEQGAEVGVDQAAKYGFWERKDGSEGGGLWFDRDLSAPEGSPQLELIDYDGAACLPARVVKALRDAGYTVDSTFD